MIVYIHKNCRRRSAFPRIITKCFSHRMAAYSIFQIKFSRRMLDNPECLGTAQMSTIIFSFKNIILTGNLFQELHDHDAFFLLKCFSFLPSSTPVSSIFPYSGIFFQNRGEENSPFRGTCTFCTAILYTFFPSICQVIVMPRRFFSNSA